MRPSPPAATSVLPSWVRLKPITPGFGFFGSGGDGWQRPTVCAEVAAGNRKIPQHTKKNTTLLIQHLRPSRLHKPRDAVNEHLHRDHHQHHSHQTLDCDQS